MHARTGTRTHACTHTYTFTIACTQLDKFPPPPSAEDYICIFAAWVLTAAGAQRPPCFSSEQLCADSKEPGDQQLCVLRRGQRCPERGDSVCTLTVVRPSNVNDLICPFSKKTFRTLGMRRRASFFIIF